MGRIIIGLLFVAIAFHQSMFLDCAQWRPMTPEEFVSLYCLWFSYDEITEMPECIEQILKELSDTLQGTLVRYLADVPNQDPTKWPMILDNEVEKIRDKVEIIHALTPIAKEASTEENRNRAILNGERKRKFEALHNVYKPLEKKMLEISAQRGTLYFRTDNNQYTVHIGKMGNKYIAICVVQLHLENQGITFGYLYE